ncbi:hypothetical protein Tco_1298996 [Tanacetum coccineum]
MDTTRAEQIALDDALVAPANCLKIGKSNFRLSSDLKSKESTLQVVYDVLKLTPFYKALQISADVLEIYMQEFWATATVHHHLIRFKINNKKHIVNLECFIEMLQICPKLPNQQFEELPFEEAILTFLRDLVIVVRLKGSSMSMSTSCINLGDHLLRLSTNVYVEKVLDMTVFDYLKLKFSRACTIRRTWTMPTFYGKILFIK